MIAALVFFDVALMTAVVPLLAHWHASMGLSKSASGLVVGAYSAAILLASVPVGHLADRVGPKRVTVLSTLAFAVTLPLLGFASTAWQLVAVRFAQGLCGAVSWTAALAWLNHAVPPSRRGKSLGIVTASGAGGALAGPAIGGPFVSAVGLRPATFALAILVLVAFAGAVAAPGVTPGSSPSGSWHRAAVVALREPRLWIAFVAITDVAVVSGTVQVLGPLHLGATGFSSAEIGWVFTGAAVSGTVFTLLTGRASDRVDRLGLIRGAVCALAAVASLLLLSPPVAAYAAVIVGIGTLASITYVLAYPLCADGAERGGVGHGMAMGALSAVWGVGALLSPVAAGAIGHAAGDRTAYAGAVLVALTAFLAIDAGVRRA